MKKIFIFIFSFFFSSFIFGLECDICKKSDIKITEDYDKNTEAILVDSKISHDLDEHFKYTLKSANEGSLSTVEDQICFLQNSHIDISEIIKILIKDSQAQDLLCKLCANELVAYANLGDKASLKFVLDNKDNLKNLAAEFRKILQRLVWQSFRK